jgi:hypothetical protein
MTVCVGAVTGFGTGTTMTGFAGPIPCGCRIVSMMPVGMGSRDGGTGYLFKPVPTEWVQNDTPYVKANNVWTRGNGDAAD